MAIAPFYKESVYASHLSQRARIIDKTIYSELWKIVENYRSSSYLQNDTNTFLKYCLNVTLQNIFH
jgi:hypothetical protein